MKRSGFTLIEILVSLAILAILMSIALPSYSRYVKNAQLSEAQHQLAANALLLEGYYQDNRHYGASDTGCGIDFATSNSAAFTYTCTLENLPGQTFLLTATGQGQMTGYSLTLNQQNQKRTTAFPEATGLPKACWISSASQTC